MIKLLLLDVDGTIVQDYHSVELLPTVILTLNIVKPRYIALVSNQGGVGLRLFRMRNGPPTNDYPLQLPTEEDVRRRLLSIGRKLQDQYLCPLDISFALRHPIQDENFDCPRPDGGREWSRFWRKPNPGMLVSAITHFRYTCDSTIEHSQCLMVGDRPEDEQAAAAAGVPFQWAKDFFK